MALGGFASSLCFKEEMHRGDLQQCIYTALIYSKSSEEADSTRKIFAAVKEFTKCQMKIYAKEALRNSDRSAYHEQRFQAYMELQDRGLTSSQKKKARREINDATLTSTDDCEMATADLSGTFDAAAPVMPAAEEKELGALDTPELEKLLRETLPLTYPLKPLPHIRDGSADLEIRPHPRLANQNGVFCKSKLGLRAGKVIQCVGGTLHTCASYEDYFGNASPEEQKFLSSSIRRIEIKSLNGLVNDRQLQSLYLVSAYPPRPTDFGVVMNDYRNIRDEANAVLEDSTAQMDDPGRILHSLLREPAGPLSIRITRDVKLDDEIVLDYDSVAVENPEVAPAKEADPPKKASEKEVHAIPASDETPAMMSPTLFQILKARNFDLGPNFSKNRNNVITRCYIHGDREESVCVVADPKAKDHCKIHEGTDFFLESS